MAGRRNLSQQIGHGGLTYPEHPFLGPFKVHDDGQDCDEGQGKNDHGISVSFAIGTAGNAHQQKA